MFLSPTRPRSIASQLVFLFTLAAAFLLSCGLGAFYLIVVRHAFEEDNEFLAARLSALRGELSQTGGLGSLTATLRNTHASKVEAYWVREMSSNGGGALGLGILASAMIAIAVTKRGLRPLQQMTQSLERIGPSRLDERVGKTTWPRELQQVATAFDEMLARLENSFTKLSQFSADL